MSFKVLKKVYGIQGNFCKKKDICIYILKKDDYFFFLFRAGEPLWAEISRLIFRFSFLAIFIMISIILIIQVQNSPIIDQIHRDEHSLMLAPHLRICFDGWQPVLQCTTNSGESCNQHVQNITQQVNGNLNYYGEALTCYLFQSDWILSNHRLKNHHGSSLQFYYYGNVSNKSLVHVESYHPLHDPNLPVYGLTGDFDQWYSEDENAKFQSFEQSNLKTHNVFHLDPTKSSQIGYEYKRREKMDRTLWNYIGFGTRREIIHQIVTVQYQSTTIDKSNEQENVSLLPFVGSLDVFPTSYSTLVMREQRAFTVIHGIGIIGGIFGLMIGFQASVFGYRPRSPWGIVHRWTVAWMRKSLLDGLRARFSNHVHIPIVHPVYNSHSQEIHRMTSLEERLNVFEFLFQAYYIDDEVFRSLGGGRGGTEGV